MNTGVEGLADLIAKELTAYTDEVAENVKKAVDVVADEVDAEIRQNVSFIQRTKRYVKAFRVKTVRENKLVKVKLWHVTGGHHRLTHLLEKGHALRGGGRARAFPHIQYGEELAKRRMEELARKAVEDAGG